MKKNKGITLISLVVTIIILIILAGVSISMLVGENGLITMAQKAKENTQIAEQEERESMQLLANELQGQLEGGEKIQQNYVNAPKLVQGMTPIKFADPTENTEGTIEETNSEDEQWYNYDEKKWANIKTEDGSMWVWIPRFAYRINTSNQTFDIVFLIEDTDKYYDANGNIQTAKRYTSEVQEMHTTTDYTVHPAFTNESSVNYRNGGWDKEITGIWVAKFEAGYAGGNNNAQIKASAVNYTEAKADVRSIEANGDEITGDKKIVARNWLDGIYGETVTPIKYPVFQPLTYSMNYITQNDAYSIARALTQEGNIYGFKGGLDSHLMKNSEWGACVYLSKSKYGLYTENIAINNISLNSGNRQRTETKGQSGVDSVYAVTGCTMANTSVEEKKTTIEDIMGAKDSIYTWKQKEGTKASTTGTIYGIYDMSGGLWERTAGYVANESANLKTYGTSMTYENNNLKMVSTKHETVYLHDTTTDNGSIESNTTNLEIASRNNYIKNKLMFGDAIKETSTQGVGTNSWGNNTSIFPALNDPFTRRGGGLWSNNAAGLFSFHYNVGRSYYDTGFRVALIVE